MENIPVSINGRGIRMLCSVKGEKIKEQSIQMTPKGVPAIYSEKYSEVHSAYRYLQKVNKSEECTEYIFLLDRKLAAAFALPEGEKTVPYARECPKGFKVAMKLDRVKKEDGYYYKLCVNKNFAARYELQMITLL